LICPLPQLPQLPPFVAASDDVPRRSFLLRSVFLSSDSPLFSRVPFLPPSHAELLLSTQRPTRDRTKRGRTDRVTHTHRRYLSFSLSLSLVAKRSFVVPLFAVVRTSSLTMISCKGLLCSSYSFGRIGPSCGICGRHRHQGI